MTQGRVEMTLYSACEERNMGWRMHGGRRNFPAMISANIIPYQ